MIGIEANKCFYGSCSPNKRLRGTEILAEARKHVDIDIYMSDLNEDKLPNCEFVVNLSKSETTLAFIVNTLILEELQMMVDEVKQDNEERDIKKKNLSVRMHTEFEKIFADVKEVSSKLNIINYFMT